MGQAADYNEGIPSAGIVERRPGIGIRLPPLPA
jgi:hypothetical protein